MPVRWPEICQSLHRSLKSSLHTKICSFITCNRACPSSIEIIEGHIRMRDDSVGLHLISAEAYYADAGLEHTLT